MKTFARLSAALGLAALFATTAVFAQAPSMGKPTAVKGYTKMTKSGKMVHVKGYTRNAKPKITYVKGYTKTLKNGQTVKVMGYSRKAPMKSMKPMMKKTM